MKTSRHVLLAGAPLLFFTFSHAAVASDAVSNTGNELIGICNEANYSAQGYAWGYCTGFVIGVAEGQELGILESVLHYDVKQNYDAAQQIRAQLTGYCVPENATRQQMALVGTKYLKDHPAELNQPSHWLIVRAFADAWPCKK